ncbi:unnamed protein product [Clonostachys rosea f. rosea IK726]|uniref:Uncharacterized protein n=1 Tax=Clonostachys rosea f. rosea IK726 TaxID=1349383 RepID=A0ACA9TPT9_BIOOC|nr:unnamed protein product [Clonostachys rosea f. rosea IK726]
MLQQISEHDGKGPEKCWRILSATAFAYRPLNLHELHALSRLDEYNMKVNDVEGTVRLCRSFLTTRKDHVYLIHQSAKDFLTGTSPRKTFLRNPEKIHYDLFRRSIKVMGGVLKRDMYNLFLPGITIDRVSRPDPNPLKEAEYSCVYWVNHYCDFYKANIYTTAQNVPTHSDIIIQFLQKYLLNWFEALSLLHRLDDGVRAMRRLEQLLEEYKEPSSRQLRALVYDCRRFLLQNKWMIEKAPLQIYVSALLFSPSESIIRNIFRNEEPDWIGIKPRVEKKWSRCLQTLQGHKGSVSAIAFSSDSRLLASGSHDSTIRIWDPDTGAELHRLIGHKGHIRSVAFLHYNANLLASGSSDGSIRLWDLETGTELMKLEHNEDHFHSVIILRKTPNLLVSGSHQAVRLWNLETGSVILTLEGHKNHILSIALSNYNTNLLASGSADWSVRIWDVYKGSTLHVLKGHQDWVTSVAFSNISKVLASASHDNTIRLWDSEKGTALKTRDGYSSSSFGISIATIAFSHNSHVLASSSGPFGSAVRLWDTETGLELQKLERHERPIESVAFCDNSKVLASASRDNTIRLWDPEPTSEPEKSAGHQMLVRTLAFSHNAKFLASGSSDCTMRLWDSNTGSELCVLCHEEEVNSVTFSYDSKMLASVFYGWTIRIWDPETRKELRRFNSCGGPVVFSYNSKLLASGSPDGTISIFDLEDGLKLHSLEGHRASASCLCIE